MNTIDLYTAAKGLIESRLPGNELIIAKILHEKYGLGESSNAIIEDQVYSLIEKARQRALYRTGEDLHPMDEAYVIISKALSERDRVSNIITKAGRDPVNAQIDQNYNPGQLTSKHSVSDVYSLLRDIYAFVCPSGQSVDHLDEINNYVRSGFGPVQFPTDPEHNLKEWKSLLEKAIGSEAFYAKDEVNQFFNDISADNISLEADSGKQEKPSAQNAQASPVPVKIKGSDPGLQNKSGVESKMVPRVKSGSKGASSAYNDQAAEDLLLSIMDRKRDQGWTWEKIRSFFKTLINKES